jgi:hypothetical protein
MIEPIKIEGEKNRELKQKLNEVIEVVNKMEAQQRKNNEDIAWLFANLHSILKTPPLSPTSLHSGESLNGLVATDRFTVQSASQESLSPTVLEQEDDEPPVGTIQENFPRQGWLRVKRHRGWEVLKDDDYLKESNG